MDLRVFKEVLQSLGSKYVVFKDITEKKLLYPFKVDFCNNTSDYSIICDAKSEHKVKDIFSSNFLVTAEQILKIISDSDMRIPPEDCKIFVEDHANIYDIGGLTYQNDVVIIFVQKIKAGTVIYNIYE